MRRKVKKMEKVLDEKKIKLVQARDKENYSLSTGS